MKYYRTIDELNCYLPYINIFYCFILLFVKMKVNIFYIIKKYDIKIGNGQIRYCILAVRMSDAGNWSAQPKYNTLSVPLQKLNKIVVIVQDKFDNYIRKGI